METFIEGAIVNRTPGEKVHFSLTGIRLTPLELKEALDGVHGLKIDHTCFEVICTITDNQAWDQASLLKELEHTARKEEVKSKHRELFDYIKGSSFVKFRRGMARVYVEPFMREFGEGFVGRLGIEFCRDTYDNPKKQKYKDRVQLVNTINGSRLDYTPAYAPDKIDCDLRQSIKDKLRERTYDFLVAELTKRELAAK